jgi:hypothetical protein
MSQEAMDSIDEVTELAKKSIQLGLTTKPYLRPRQNRNEVLMRNMLNAMADRMVGEETILIERILCISNDLKCSMKGIQDFLNMRPITFREMMVNHIHKDCYLICRIIGVSSYITQS